MRSFIILAFFCLVSCGQIEKSLQEKSSLMKDSDKKKSSCASDADRLNLDRLIMREID